VDPEPVRAAATGQERHGLARSVLGACLPDVVPVKDQHVARQWLAAAPFPVARIAAREHGHVVVPHQRPPSLQVTDNVRAATSGW
jgi:hypothetical protein